MEKLHTEVQSIINYIDSKEPLNLIELNNAKAIKYLCSHMYNIVTLYGKGLLTSDFIISIPRTSSSKIFEMRGPIIKKYIKVTDTEKERLERLIKESQEGIITKLNNILNQFREIIGVHNYVAMSPISDKGEHRITVAPNEYSTKFIIVSETTYILLKEIDNLYNMFSRYITDRIVEEEYERINQK